MRALEYTQQSVLFMTWHLNTADTHRAADPAFAGGVVVRTADVSGSKTGAIAMLCPTVHGPRGYSSG